MHEYFNYSGTQSLHPYLYLSCKKEEECACSVTVMFFPLRNRRANKHFPEKEYQMEGWIQVETMKRRDFLKTSGAAVLTVSVGANCFAGLPDSRKLVATAADRERYLARLLQELCIDIGPRPYSSPEYLRATEVVMREMKLGLPDVSYDPFTNDRWRLDGSQSMTIDGQPITAYLYMNSPGTPPGGLTGVLRLSGDSETHYQLVVPGSDQVLAHLFIQSSPHARPIYYGPALAERVQNLPAIGIGKDDTNTLAQAAERGVTVTYEGRATWDHNVESRNVVGILPGESEEECVFLAHLDTVYTAPGANDNTATLILMLMWAHAFSGRRPRKTLTFITPDVEECGMTGASKYVEKRKAAGTFGRIKYVFNFDSFTWGPDFIIYGRDDGLISIFNDAKKEHNIGGEVKVNDHDGFWLDAQPFRDEGIRAISVSTGGSDVFDRCWHQPADLPENISVEWVENNFLIFTRFIGRVLEL